MTPAMLVLVRSAPVRFVRLRMAPLRSEPVRSASIRLAQLRLALDRLAPVRSAAVRSAHLRSVPDRSAPFSLACQVGPFGQVGPFEVDPGEVGAFQVGELFHLGEVLPDLGWGGRPLRVAEGVVSCPGFPEHDHQVSAVGVHHSSPGVGQAVRMDVFCG